MRIKYCDLNIVNLRSEDEIVLDNSEIDSVPALPQILQLTRSKLSMENDEVSCIIGVGGVKYCKDDGVNTVYSKKGILMCAWKPCISLTGLENFLTKQGVLEEKKTLAIFNPLFSSTCIPYDNTLLCMEAFSARRLETDITEKQFSEIVFTSNWRLRIDRGELLLSSPIGTFYRINTGYMSTFYDGINNVYIMKNDSVDIAVNKRHNVIYVNTMDDLILEGNLKSYQLAFLNPYYVATMFIDNNAFVKSNVGWLLIEEPHVLGIVNPRNKIIEIGKNIVLEKGEYMLLPMDGKNYGFVHNCYLSSIINGSNYIILEKSFVAYNKYLIRMYPSKALVGDLVFDVDKIVFTIFNPHENATLIEYYAVFPFEKITIRNAWFPEGYEPVYVKPNLARITLRPWEVALVSIVFRKIPIRTLKYMLFIRGSMG